VDSRMNIWTGRTLVALFAAFILVASVAPKLAQAEVARAAMVPLGWSEEHLLTLGLIELGCLILYLVPRTRILGALLTTALLGGAIAAHLRVGSPLFSHTLFGIYLGAILWGGAWLLDPALRALIPLRRPSSPAQPGKA
jgi:hypothetical protein